MERKILKYMTKKNQYYPTPEYLIKKILINLDFSKSDLPEIHMLEPTAGDGAIARVARDYFESINKKAVISTIEIETTLNQALQGQGFRVIGQDFNNYIDKPHYDLILMNPPFNQGSKFLLKAYKSLASNGELICLLNAETIKNPYSKERKELLNLISSNGEVEILEKAFDNAKVETNVEIAIVHLKKPNYGSEFDLFGNINQDILTHEELLKNQYKSNINQKGIVSFNQVEAAISIYRQSAEKIFQGIQAIKVVKQSLNNLNNEANEFDINIDTFFHTMCNKSPEEAREETISNLRKMIWSYVLKHCDMDKYLYTKHKQEFYENLQKGSSTLPFTKENVQSFFDTIFMQKQELFKRGTIDLFEKILTYHKDNENHREGWKTNKNWKINEKIIIPSWGIKFLKYNYENYGKYEIVSDNLDWLNDLDRIIRTLDLVSYDEKEHCDNYVKNQLEECFRDLGKVYDGQKYNNKLETRYFKIKFFKKGTLHIEFKSKKVLDLLNVAGANCRTDLGYQL